MRTVIVAFIVAMSAACTRASQQSPSAERPDTSAPAVQERRDASTAVPQTETETPSDEVIARVTAPWTGDLDGMVERHAVRMLVTFSKTHYFVDRGEQKGLAYDAGKILETFLNDRLKTGVIKLHVVCIPTSRDSILEDLAKGRGDIAAAGLTITPERSQMVDFARPTFSDVREVAVTAADQPPVTNPDDLSGRTVHVRRSSSYFQSLAALNRELTVRGQPPVHIIEAPEALEDEDLLEMVNGGLIPVTIVDDYLAQFWSKIFDGIRVQPATVRSGGQIAWAIRKNTPHLHEALEAFGRENAKGSRNYNMLLQKYLRNTAYVKNSINESEIRKFRQLRAFFQKYGAQYDLPWLLLAAQGYQESQLDQARKSGVGAVGVMQIKPSTAEGAPIRISGVDVSAEKNIQAGVKYLRFIVDEYYKAEPMDRLNKGLFAVASYNAGPARIAGLRRKAARLGLDPNRWFANVEVVAARDIGRETVTYVANIFKYYVSYNLVMQQAAERRRTRDRQVGR